MSEVRKHRALVWLTEQERAEMERLAPLYGYEGVEDILPTIIRGGIAWARGEERRWAREAKKATRRLKEKPPVRNDDDIPF